MLSTYVALVAVDTQPILCKYNPIEWDTDITLIQNGYGWIEGNKGIFVTGLFGSWNKLVIIKKLSLNIFLIWHIGK